MAGNTTLLTTVLICVDAVAQVLSTAPATSPVPAAKAVVPIMQTSSRDSGSIIQRRLHFILLIDTSIFGVILRARYAILPTGHRRYARNPSGSY